MLLVETGVSGGGVVKGGGGMISWGAAFSGMMLTWTSSFFSAISASASSSSTSWSGSGCGVTFSSSLTCKHELF